MKRSSRLLAAILLIVAFTGCRGWTSEDPPVHLMWNMDTQEKPKAYRKEELFADGRMMRTPPEGTVARGYLHDDNQLTTGMDAEGKPLQKLPDSFKADASTVARGKNRVGIYCAPCHGKDNDGKGVVGPKGLMVPPPSFMDARLVEMPAGQIYKAIHDGVNAPNMPSYAVQIPEQDRWAIVAFLCTLATGEADPTKACANKKAEDVTSKPIGYQLWKSKGCNACHTLDGNKGVGPTWKGLAGKSENTDKGAVTVDAAYLEESIKTPNAKVVAGFPPAMPALPMTDDEVKSLVDFIMNDPSLRSQ